MAYEKFNTKDNAQGQLLASINSSVTSIVVKSGQGALFPTTKFIVTLTEVTAGVVTKMEKCLCTSRSGDTLTVTRGYDSSTAQSFSADDYVTLMVNSTVITDIQDEVTRLETAKLNTAGGTRTGLTNWRLYYSNGTGAETALALGTSGQVLQSNGATSDPTFVSPSVDINGLAAVTTVADVDELLVNVVGTGNRKVTVDSLYEQFMLWGSGKDGNVTISTNTTLTRDMFYKTLTVNTSITLNTGGFRIYAWEVINNGTIHRDGTVGTVGVSGGAVHGTGGVMTGGTTGLGGNGGNAAYTTGNTGQAITSIGGNNGGAGGTGSGLTGGTGGVRTQGNGVHGLLQGSTYIADGAEKTYYEAKQSLYRAGTVDLNGGAGGGSGASNSVGPGYGGGGGGSGGGVCYIQSRIITNNGTIRANGGNGGNGAPGNFTSGGGGGGGGCVALIYDTLTLGTVQTNGGTGGTGGSGGPSGASGSNGQTLRIKV